MKKNIVFLHLESLPQLQLWQYRKQLPTIWRLMERSMYFERCFASGTATTFAICGLFFGSVCVQDHYTKYIGHYSEPPSYAKNNFVDFLTDEHNYISAMFNVQGYVNTDMTRVTLFDGMLPQFSETKACLYPDGWSDCIHRYLREVGPDKPFFLYIRSGCDYPRISGQPISFLKENVACDIGDIVAKSIGIHDHVLDILLRAMELHGILDETVLVAYADHGADILPWFDSFHGGRRTTSMHAHVPLMIFNSPLGVGTNDQLVALEDIPVTLSRLLFPEAASFRPKRLFPGIDFTAERRDYIVTQQKHALQENGKHLTKSYSITDGSYRLIAEQYNEDRQMGGLSLFDERLDPYNSLDMLRWFELDDAGKVSGLQHDMLAEQKFLLYPPLGNLPSLSALAKRFEALRDALRSHVREKEADALRRAPAGIANIMREKSFTFPALEWTRKEGGKNEGIGPGIKDIVDLGQPVLVMGFGYMLGTIIATLDFYGVETLAILDNDEKKQRVRYIGMPEILSPEEAAEKYPQAVVIAGLLRESTNLSASMQCKGLGMKYYSYFADIIGSSLWSDKPVVK